MRNVKRYFREGNVYFLTHVTHKRNPILTEHFDLLWDSFKKCKTELRYELIAWVVLPDHMHLLVDPIKCDLSGLMRKIKLTFSGRFRYMNKNPKGRVWQNRYWDHVIRDEEDLKRHIDYIHINPVKHNLVANPLDYNYSSFNDYIEKGLYEKYWGIKDIIEFDGDFGE